MPLSTVSIVIPVYNEQQTIKTLIARVKKANARGLRKQIIVIDDASSDHTYRILKRLKGIQIFRHRYNRGKGAAIRTGLKKATGDIILIQDADLEYSPSDYPKLLTPFFTLGADVVYGSRFRGGEATRVIYFSHYVANHILTLYSNIWTNINLTDMECGYKVFRKTTVDQIRHRLVSNRFGIEPELTARIAKIDGIKIFEVGISYQGRTYQEGKKIGLIDGVKALIQITWFNLWN